MAKPNYSFEKRQRELAKKKKEEKLKEKAGRKVGEGAPDDAPDDEDTATGTPPVEPGSPAP